MNFFNRCFSLNIQISFYLPITKCWLVDVAKLNFFLLRYIICTPAKSDPKQAFAAVSELSRCNSHLWVHQMINPAYRLGQIQFMLNAGKPQVISHLLNPYELNVKAVLNVNLMPHFVCECIHAMTQLYPKVSLSILEEKKNEFKTQPKVITKTCFTHSPCDDKQ